MKTKINRYMKTIARALTLCLMVAVAACERTPDAPPIIVPEYDGPPANTTIAELRDMYADQLTTSNSTAFIEYEYIIKCVVIGNDQSGNIYKQLYVRDDTGAINIGVDQNSMYTDYRVGQTVYLNVHNLYLVNYGGEIQIGYGGTNANRIDWDIFTSKALKDGAPDPAKVLPVEKTFAQLTPADVNTLVRFNDVYFLEGGEATFAVSGGYGERAVSDGSTTSLIMRTSQYADFAEETLPEGGGDVIAILGRYNGGWQLLLRSTEDLLNFGKPLPEAPPVEGLVFQETFGAEKLSAATAIDAFTGWDNPSFTFSGTADIRSTGSLDNHVWIKSGAGNFKIEGINGAGATGLTLSYDVTANLYDAGTTFDVSILKVYCNGTEIPVPSHTMSNANGDNNTYYTVTLTGLPDGVTTIEFVADASNTLGIRLDNITLASGDGGGIVIPPGGGGSGDEVEFFKETCGTETLSTNPRPLVSNYTGWAMNAPVAYSDPTGRADLRSTARFDNHIWLPATTGSGSDASVVISGINTSGYTDITLSIDITANVGTYDDSVKEANLNVLKVTVDGATKTIPSTVVKGENGDQNQYHSFTFTDIPSKTDLTIEFHTDASNTAGMRLDNITLKGKAAE